MSDVSNEPARALLLVDIQRDFLPGGALAVPHGDAILPIVNAIQPAFDLIVASRDWHPADHGSFASQHPGTRVGDVVELDGLSQTVWPDHCIQGTEGAKFADGLDRTRWDHVVTKGTTTTLDSYSAFFDNGHRQSTGLGDYLGRRGVERVYVAGLATNVCVKFTVLDACNLGFATFLITDACRGVDISPGDVDASLQEMQSAGVQFVTSENILA